MKANNRNSIILSSLGEVEEAIKAASDIPAGYVEVRLSTKGKVGAPAVLHVRNFKVSDIVTLSISSNTELPVRLINILNDMIWEDTDVATWHEKEVEELMVMIFLTFYKGVLNDMPFVVDDKDYEFLENQEGGKEKIEALKSGKWVPKVDINIVHDVSTYDVADDFSPKVSITNRKTGFKVVFNYIKYGDQIIIKNWLDSYFAKDEARFAKVKKQIEINNDLSRQFLDNPESFDKYIQIDKNEENAYKEYLVRRAQVITDVANIISIIEIDGEDISGMSVGEKYEKYGNDARIDYRLMSKLASVQADSPIGIKPEVEMRDPITGEVVKRPFSFRIPLIIQALQLSGNDDDDDCYDVEIERGL